MATIEHIPSDVATFGDRSTQILWETMTTTDDTGSRVEMPGSSLRSVQVVGTFGVGGTISIQGSNDGTTWAILESNENVAITLTATGLVMVRDITRFIRPFISGGDGTTDLDVYMIARRPF